MEHHKYEYELLYNPIMLSHKQSLEASVFLFSMTDWTMMNCWAQLRGTAVALWSGLCGWFVYLYHVVWTRSGKLKVKKNILYVSMNSRNTKKQSKGLSFGYKHWMKWGNLEQNSSHTRKYTVNWQDSFNSFGNLFKKLLYCIWHLFWGSTTL